MRVKDENKKNAICNAAIELITKNGFADTSMSKIAKVAGISSSTIYVYFKNKEDMLNKLYLWVKHESSIVLFIGFNETIPIKEGIEKFWFNTYRYILAEPVKFYFSEQFANSPHLNKLSKKEGSKYYKPLFDLLERGIEQKIIKNIAKELLSAQIIAPIIFLGKKELSREIHLTEEMLQNAFYITWDAIKI